MRGAAGLRPASLVSYDVPTLYFETDAGDRFREPGFFKERGLEPQITSALLTDATGSSLMVQTFEDKKAETSTMLRVIRAFMKAHRLTDVTVVADAGMVSEANKRAIEADGRSLILRLDPRRSRTWSRPGGGSTRRDDPGIQLSAGTKSVNRDWRPRPARWQGSRAYLTNPTPEVATPS